MPENASQRIGRGKLKTAIHGKDNFGRQFSDADRKKLLRSGGEDITRGNAEASTVSTLGPLLGLPGLEVVLSGSGRLSDNDVKKVEAKVTAEQVNRGVSPDISESPLSTTDQLTESILRSAAGQPFDFSISEQKKKQDAAKQAIKLMMLNENLGTSGRMSDKDVKTAETKTK